ncbi:uncharacterized protein LOC142312739 [Anomaloglossus baeobatrachus]|uniref:uncharacterized protein LOC142312739 n=1 Tax=Anomaloglossus baeobatrachus TaxID=238106 RepID=UPI003F4FC4AE
MERSLKIVRILLLILSQVYVKVELKDEEEELPVSMNYKETLNYITIGFTVIWSKNQRSIYPAVSRMLSAGGQHRADTPGKYGDNIQKQCNDFKARLTLMQNKALERKMQLNCTDIEEEVFILKRRILERKCQKNVMDCKEKVTQMHNKAIERKLQKDCTDIEEKILFIEKKIYLLEKKIIEETIALDRRNQTLPGKKKRNIRFCWCPAIRWIHKIKTIPPAFKPYKFKKYIWRPSLATIQYVCYFCP